jgi:rSAM/selenodomain-associated transferase 1
MPLSRLAIVLMTKHPTPGRVKTRLMPELSPEQAAAVHGVFLGHLTARLARLNPAELVICFDPAEREGEMRGFLGRVTGLTFNCQCAGDLGVRIATAARDVLARHERVLLLGTDSPDVPVAHLFAAAGLVEQSPVSISPTTDGGYWALGLQRGVDAGGLLAEIPWSSGHEAFETLRAAGRLGLSAATGLAWDDIDRAEDLRRLLTRLSRSEAAGIGGADLELLRNLRPILPPGWGS